MSDPAVRAFTSLDYVICSSLLVISTAIGLYFMVKDRKFQKRLYKDIQTDSTLMTNLEADPEENPAKEKFLGSQLPIIADCGPDFGAEKVPLTALPSGGSLDHLRGHGASSSPSINTSSDAISDRADLGNAAYSKEEIRKILFENYHLADKKLHFLPVSFSLTASFMSALTMIGWPPEFYLYGSMFVYFSLSYFIAAFVSTKYFMGVGG